MLQEDNSDATIEYNTEEMVKKIKELVGMVMIWWKRSSCECCHWGR